MGFWKNVADFIALPDASGVERKNGVVVTTSVQQTSADVIEAMLLGDSYCGGNARVSAVHACARVIAEGLALPPCYLHREDAKGRSFATDHPLFYLLNRSPNDRQTSYEFREMMGWHLALDSNAYVWINRSRRDGSILELLPCDPGKVTVSHDDTGLWGKSTYYLYGVPVPADQVWHLKGPSWHSWTGSPTVAAARRAIGLASATETFGSKLFENGARPAGIIRPANGQTLTADQVETLRTQTQAYAGAQNAHKTMVLTGPVDFTPMSASADEAQFIETRRFQIEEICRYFRVSPIKVFQQVGSQSYSSVEQAHIAHDQDTDAHWHERFVQSANKALLTDKERKAGLCVSVDNRAALRGTAKERMEYYTAGIAAGIITRNEAREMEGWDRSSDPEADKLTPAANLFGDQAGAKPALSDQTAPSKGE